MDDLAPLLDSGFEISLQRGDGGTPGRKYECLVTTPEGDVLTDTGVTPAAALQSTLLEVLKGVTRNLAGLAHIPAQTGEVLHPALLGE